MKLSFSLLFVCPAVLCAQTPPPAQTAQPAQTPPPASRPATPVPPVSSQPVRNPDGSVTSQIPIHVTTPPPQVPPDKVIITVGDFTLTAAQFDAMIDSLPEQQRSFVKGPGRKMFADQITQVLSFAEEGKKRKLDDTDAYKTQLELMKMQLLAQAVAASINKDLKIDDAQLLAYYDAHKSEYELVKARHILVRFKGSQVPLKAGSKELTDEEALAKANLLIGRLKAGEDFAKLASAESDEPNADKSGGSLGEFGHGQMVPSFDEAAFKLPVGQVSEPVKSQFGYHIILVESHRIKSFDEVKADIEKKLRPQQAQKAMQAIQSSTKIVLDPVFFQMEAK